MQSILFKFYYDGELRLQTKDGAGEVLDSKLSDGTKFVEWKFTTSFNRSDNGDYMRCHVNWIELLSRPDLKSTNTKNVQVICKCQMI